MSSGGFPSNMFNFTWDLVSVALALEVSCLDVVAVDVLGSGIFGMSDSCTENTLYSPSDDLTLVEFEHVVSTVVHAVMPK